MSLLLFTEESEENRMRMGGKKRKTEHLEKLKQRNRSRKADKRTEASP